MNRAWFSQFIEIGIEIFIPMAFELILVPWVFYNVRRITFIQMYNLWMIMHNIVNEIITDNLDANI